MRAWLTKAIEAGLDLSGDAEGYLRGRGLTGSVIRELGLSQWVPPESAAPDATFEERYGKGGRVLAGRIVIPFLSPRGKLLGVEVRSWEWGHDKRITDYRLRECAWNPVFIGLTPAAMQRIWDGGDVWVVEGLFDRVLTRIVPDKDVVLATVRAKLSDAHVEFFRRHLRKGAKVNMVYDNDETGRKQTDGWDDEKTGKRRWGALERLDRVSVPCRDVPYRGGKDPGVIWDNGGEEALRRAFAHVI